jgi:single-strand DNA-binding protein
MMQIAAHGRLGQDPKEITTKTGTKMAVATIAVTLDTRGEDQETEWFGLVAFGKLAESLLRHKRGDMLSASGRVQINTWTTDGGEQRRQFQIVADSVVSARTVRPGGGKRRSQGQGTTRTRNGAQSFQEPAPFDDPIAF